MDGTQEDYCPCCPHCTPPPSTTPTFQDTHKTALRHMHEKLEGKEPTYGDACAALFEQYLAEA